MLVNTKKISFNNKIRYLIIISLILTVIVNIAFAHSGRTDAYGGHYNRKTGVYHYHSGSHHISQNSLTKSDILFIGFIVIMLMPMAVFFIKEIIEIIQNKIESIKRFNAEKKMYKELYEDKNICEFVNIPNGTIIREDGLPYGEDISEYFKYGKHYTRYHSNRSNVYHSNYGCSGVEKQINTHKLRGFQLRPCLRCASNDAIPDTSFVDEYNKIVLISKKYNINIEIPQYDNTEMN